MELMRELDEASVDAIVTDPPYGLEFMGKEWDRLGAVALHDPSVVGGFQDGNGGNAFSRSRVRFGESAKSMQAWHEAWATEALRVLKPGGHLLAFGGTRTYHRLACAIEDAGFEIRDCLAWIFGSGFPKSLDVSKAIDKAAGVERERGPRTSGALNAGTANGWSGSSPDSPTAPLAGTQQVGPPVTDDARTWNGWGTALKPAHEPIVVARKPLTGTVAANVLEHGTGALNVDGCRIAGEPRTTHTDGNVRGVPIHGGGTQVGVLEEGALGRWPANVVLDEEAAGMLDEQTGELHTQRAGTGSHGYGVQGVTEFRSGTFDGGYGDSGGASRFFYVAKASRAERNAGLEGFEGITDVAGSPTKVKCCDECGRRFAVNYATCPRCDSAAWTWTSELGTDVKGPRRGNVHPTVKPVALMRWLVRLITPPGGTVLDPFAGSGTTGLAAALEGFDFIGMEQDADYAKIAEARIAFWTEHGEDGLRIVAERERAEAEREAVAASGQLDIFGAAE